MGLFSKNDKQSVLQRMAETQLFEYVMDEIEEGSKHKGVWGQALVEAEGDADKAEAAYIKLRVASLKDKVTLDSIIEDERLQAIQALVRQETKENNETIEEMREREKAEMMARIDANRAERGEA